jgi:hypothetical protein
VKPGRRKIFVLQKYIEPQPFFNDQVVKQAGVERSPLHVSFEQSVDGSLFFSGI